MHGKDSFKMETVNSMGETPGPQFGHSTTSVPSLNSLCVMRGLDYTQFSFSTVPKDEHMYLFNPDTHVWRKVWLGCQPRAFHNAVVVNNSLYIIIRRHTTKSLHD